MQELRDGLLASALPHVPFEGWGEEALRAGAADAGIELRVARRAFPRPAIDMVAHFSAMADRRMEAELARCDLSGLRLPQRVAQAVRLRLERNAEHREAVRLALGVLAMPPYGIDALRSLYRTVDAIWFAVGDESTDFSFYTKRLLLAGIYLSTLLCWLGDESEGSAETWAFLERRLADLARLRRTRRRMEKFMADRPSLLRLLRGGARPARSEPRPPTGSS